MGRHRRRKIIEKVKIFSQDAKIFEEEIRTVSLSGTLRKTIEELKSNSAEDSKNVIFLVLSETPSAVLENIFIWCRQHKNDSPIVEKGKEFEEQYKVLRRHALRCGFKFRKHYTIETLIKDVPQWDKDFFENLSLVNLHQLRKVAHTLDIKVLKDYGSRMFMKRATEVLRDSKRDLSEMACLVVLAFNYDIPDCLSENMKVLQLQFKTLEIKVGE